jgi:hypothetical protein
LSPGSASVAVTVVTAVVFSATFTTALLPPPFDVMIGSELAATTVKVMTFGDWSVF